MNIYRILRIVGAKGLPPSVKIAGLWAMHILGKRTLGIFIDPVLSCNLRCKMCYFSDSAKRKSLHGSISGDYLDNLEKSLFHRALKLQIGCGAEPTLFPRLADLIARGKAGGIPYISLTTNGQLIAEGKIGLRQLVDAGLNEITLSTHGTTPEIYEQLMPGAKFENLLALLNEISAIKGNNPDFKLRINFTINSLNIHDLDSDKFWGLFKDTRPDIIQLRPVQKIGESAWTDFDLTPIRENYDSTIGAIGKRCKELGIVFIAPSQDNLEQVASEQGGFSAAIEDFTYCYVSPDHCYKPDFNPATDTYETYHRRHHTASAMFRRIFKSSARNRNTTKKLNYNVK